MSESGLERDALALADQAARPMETIPISALGDQCRRGIRYLCHVDALYNERAEDQLADATWKEARMIDVSTRGVALVIRHPLPPGTLLRLAPMISSWRPECVLTACVTNARPGPEAKWCVGCQFTNPLSKGELQIFLQNSRSVNSTSAEAQTGKAH